MKNKRDFKKCLFIGGSHHGDIKDIKFPLMNKRLELFSIAKCSELTKTEDAVRELYEMHSVKGKSKTFYMYIEKSLSVDEALEIIFEKAIK